MGISLLHSEFNRVIDDYWIHSEEQYQTIIFLFGKNNRLVTHEDNNQ